MARSLGTTIKDTLSFNKKKEKELLQKKPPVPLIDNKGNNSLELEEARYLLALIAKTDFKGTDIQIVYNVAVKLQGIIKENLTENNG
jgi:hypothetical protein|tara:strand:+ start:286 stop:546 length:261 start_codon:yes stop_codon:yes gene_type:complete